MRRKATVYFDEDILRAARVAAARAGKRNYQVIEEALRAYLGLELLGRAGKRSRLTEEKALKIAYREVHRSRHRKWPTPVIAFRGLRGAARFEAGRIVALDKEKG